MIADRRSNSQLALGISQTAFTGRILTNSRFHLISQITRFPDHAGSPDLITLDSVISITSSQQG
jgi:hypothetical protein